MFICLFGSICMCAYIHVYKVSIELYTNILSMCKTHWSYNPMRYLHYRLFQHNDNDMYIAYVMLMDMCGFKIPTSYDHERLLCARGNPCPLLPFPFPHKACMHRSVHILTTMEGCVNVF